MNKELNVARVLKQLVYILEEHGFVFYYDKRFDVSRPQLDNKHDYLYHEFLDDPYSPLTYLHFTDNESKIDYHLDYRDEFTHTLHYSKYPYPMPRNPYTLKMKTYLDPYKEYNDNDAKQLAQKIFDELMHSRKQVFKPNDEPYTKYHEFTTLTK